MDCHKGNIYLCAFADSRYHDSAKRLMWQTLKMPFIADGFFYDESDLPRNVFIRFRSYLKPGVRGFGYWIWKPYIILDALKRTKEKDILLYLDMGCHLNEKGEYRFREYCEEVNYNSSGFLVTDVGSNHLERMWTKGDLFDFFHLRDRKEITETSQYQAGIIFIRKRCETVDLINEWLWVCTEHFRLVDDTPSWSSNLLGFRENRHDQSVLSLLLKQYGTSIIPIEECWTLTGWDELSKTYPILQMRDLR